MGENRRKRTAIFWMKEFAFYALLIIFIVGAALIRMGKDGIPVVFGGYSAFTVLTSSMEAEIPKGSLVVTKKVDSQTLQIGDDITYMANRTTTITHRIVGIIENYENTGYRAFETKGIMNESPDKLPVLEVNIVGRVIFHNLTLGLIAAFISRYWFYLVVLLVLFGGFLTALKNVFQKERTEK